MNCKKNAKSRLDDEHRLFNPAVEKVVEIGLERLRPFENHPFKVKEDEAMARLMESIIWCWSMDYVIWFTELWRWWSILLQTVVKNTMMYFIVVIAEAERLRMWTSCLNLVWAEQLFTERRRQRSGTWDITSLRLWCHNQRTNGISLHFRKRKNKKILENMQTWIHTNTKENFIRKGYLNMIEKVAFFIVLVSNEFEGCTSWIQMSKNMRVLVFSRM